MESRAVVMRGAGGPEVLEARGVQVAWPAADDAVLVRLRAAGVNPADAYFRQDGPYLGEAAGCVLGHDGAGVVEAVGSAVTRWAPGDRVCFCNGGIGGDPGTYALHAVVPERLLVCVPEPVDLAEAAALPLVFITAWESLAERARVAEAEQVLIHAGAGGTGHVAVQVARLLGARVCATVSTPEKAELVEDLGVERPIYYRDEDFVAAALDWTAGRGLAAALDNVGPEVLRRTFDAMATYGRVVTLMGGVEDTPDATAYNSNLSVANVMMLTPMWRGMRARMEEQAAMLGRGIDWLARGKLRVHVEKTFPLEAAAEAHRALEAGGVTGKIVLAIDG